MTKTNVNRNLHFNISVPTYLPPKIEETIIGDDGEEIYILANGNTSLKSRYDAMWLPTKGKINTDKKYKGENPDKTKEHYK